MKSIIVERFGDTEVMKLEEVQDPRAGKGQIRVAIKAAGVNYADIMQRMGTYPEGPQPPYPAGFEYAGEIDQIGEGVEGWRVGDRVMGLCKMGGYSEYTVVPASQALRIPEHLGFNEAAAIPCQYFTAYHVLITLGQLQSGQTVLIQAAAGGLGTILVQIAHHLGARVIGTASTDEKCELIRDLGCDHPINYKEKKFRDEVEKITEGKGCELIVETVGGRVFDLSLRCLRPLGRLIVVGVASNDPRPVYGSYLLPHNLTVSGFHLNGYLGNAQAMKDAIQCLDVWLEKGALKFLVNHTFPLEEAAEAHRQISDRKTSGKVVLTVGE
ncbi:MAG: NADPH:quinone oxidoreductase family protein [Candidatus Omnitrophica bacterium]|nr:NADPH:quinone oxidoreductase family protein [Candidatus Omnitrophota bacterium]